MNLGQFRTAVSAKTGVDNTAASTEQGYVDGWVNEGVIEVLLRTRCYVTNSSISLTSGIDEYQLSSTYLAINEVTTTSAGTTWQLDRLQPAALLQLRRASAASSSPVRFYALNGANLLMIYPPPGTSTDTITVYGTPRPTALSSATDDPSTTSLGGIPTEYHKAIEYWACFQAADFLNTPEVQQYIQLFEDRMRLIRKEATRRGGRSLGRIIAGRTRTPLAPHDPSADIRWS